MPPILRNFAWKSSQVSQPTENSRSGSRARTAAASVVPSGYRKIALPSPEKLSLSFTTALRSAGFRLLSSTSAASRSASSRRSSWPSGHATPASRKTFRLPDFVPSAMRAGSTPFSGIPRRTASLRSSGVELKTVR